MQTMAFPEWLEIQARVSTQWPPRLDIPTVHTCARASCGPDGTVMSLEVSKGLRNELSAWWVEALKVWEWWCLSVRGS